MNFTVPLLVWPGRYKDIVCVNTTTSIVVVVLVVVVVVVEQNTVVIEVVAECYIDMTK